MYYSLESFEDSTYYKANTPIDEMRKIARENPKFSFLEVISAANNQEKWDIDQLNQEQKVLYANLNGQLAIEMMNSYIEKIHINFPINGPARREQWVPTGKFEIQAKLLNEKFNNRLLKLSNRYLKNFGSKPIRIFNEFDNELDEQIYITAKKVVSNLKSNIPSSARPAILKSRTLLRRTFQPAMLSEHDGNSNNQHWHQDSNIKYNDLPMLTIWIPLQNETNITRPGIQLFNAPVSYFSADYGDSSRNITELLKPMFKNAHIVTPTVPANDGIIFNGLTFHQTYTSPNMTSHRDALLIRIIDEKHVDFFGSKDCNKEVLSLA